MTRQLGALVLEDEWPARNYLVELLEQSGRARVVAAVPSTVLATAALIGSPEPLDIAFVDVHLAGEREAEAAGLTWIEAFARVPGAPRVILTTASREHALRAFELGVSDYLLKPFTASRVAESLERVASTVSTLSGDRIASLPPASPEASEPRRIVARRGRSLVFVDVRDAWAFEAEGRLCFVHAPVGRLDVDLSLAAIEAVLRGSYLRVHRNWLVMTPHVRSIEREAGETTLIVGNEHRSVQVPVARERAASVRDALLATAVVGLRRDH
ncbi:LytR/AlgR family response regulator transcription factor [Pendulispora albinea]|uniref:LytTR family DNA-binding domain-containing protein n=1 Tax=Pendulispora albinea TaxID=2741071 RepID=A0ABZ2MAE0_9BACT